MIKNNKLKLTIASIIILLPIIAGLIMWDILPEQMATNWGTDGQANGWSSKAFAVFGLPLFIFAVNWICILATNADPKNKGKNTKVFGIVLWICPFISVYASATIYAIALGMHFSVDTISNIIIGLMFVLLGNYLPKCKQNNTIGIKIPWTLSDEDNWNKTHRLAGRVWVICGSLFMASVFLPYAVIPYVMVILIILVAGIPVIYSYCYYKKHQ